MEHVRDVKNLRMKYENLKKDTKKKLADAKIATTGTGGGPEKKATLSAQEERMAAILGARGTGLPSEFGGDCNSDSDENNKETEAPGDVEYEVRSDGSLQLTSYTPAWDSYNASQMRKSKSSALTTPIQVNQGSTRTSSNVFSKAGTPPEAALDAMVASSSAAAHSQPSSILDPIAKLVPIADLEDPNFVGDDEIVRTEPDGTIPTKRKRAVQDKMSAWAAGRAELVTLQREAFSKKQALDMMLRKKEHCEKFELEKQILRTQLKREEYLLELAKRKGRIELQLLRQTFQSDWSRRDFRRRAIDGRASRVVPSCAFTL